MRVAAVVVLGFAALMLLAGSLTASWGRGEADEYPNVRWGLQEVTYCEANGLFFRKCKTDSLSERGWDEASVTVGRATFAAGILATLAAIALAIVAAYDSRRATRVLAGVSLSASAGALLGAILFIAFLPDEATDLDPELGSSFFLYTLGCVGAMVGSSMAARTVTRERSPDEPALELPAHLAEAAAPGAPRGAMPSPVPVPPPAVDVPTCGRCSGGGVWIHETRHFACVRCNVYL